MRSRKYVRIALSEDDQAALAKAKARAENETGIAMSDSMFALSLIRHAIKPNGASLPEEPAITSETTKESGA